MQAQMGMAALSATPRKETHMHVDVGLHVHRLSVLTLPAREILEDLQHLCRSSNLSLSLRRI